MPGKMDHRRRAERRERFDRNAARLTHHPELPPGDGDGPEISAMNCEAASSAVRASSVYPRMSAASAMVRAKIVGIAAVGGLRGAFGEDVARERFGLVLAPLEQGKRGALTPG